LGYGFFKDTAFFTWALNKFLGSDCWFSTLKGRLGASAGELDGLADDADLVAEGFQWERAHPQLFAGEVDTDIAVLFSRVTRDFYGQIAGDYTNDYHATCLQLMRQGVSYGVVTEVPRIGRARRLVLSSAICLSRPERQAVEAFMAGGGTVIATGPCGFCDERANPVARPWLTELGLAVEWTDPARTGGFPPYKHYPNPTPLAECRVTKTELLVTKDGWSELLVGEGRLIWRAERVSLKGLVPAAMVWLQPDATTSVAVRGLAAGWHSRKFRDGDRRLIHFLPAKVGTVLHPSLQDQMSQQGVIERLQFAPLDGILTVESATPLAKVTLHSPDLAAPRAAQRGANGAWTLNVEGVRRYFVVECSA
jgi:hypothetical protein